MIHFFPQFVPSQFQDGFVQRRNFQDENAVFLLPVHLLDVSIHYFSQTFLQHRMDGIEIKRVTLDPEGFEVELAQNPLILVIVAVHQLRQQFFGDLLDLFFQPGLIHVSVESQTNQRESSYLEDEIFLFGVHQQPSFIVVLAVLFKQDQRHVHGRVDHRKVHMGFKVIHEHWFQMIFQFVVVRDAMQGYVRENEVLRQQFHENPVESVLRFVKENGLVQLVPAVPDDLGLQLGIGQSVMSASLSWRNGRLSGIGDPKELFTFQGSLRMLRFSPDGKRIAYQRASGIELYDFASGSISRIALPNASLSDPSWFPDGSRIAFRRSVTGQPWGIGLVDVSTLEVREVWQADPGIGSSFFGLDHEDQLLWSKDDRIAFVWERDGWRHLYSVPASGGSATLLTPGNGEVETATIRGTIHA